MAQQQDVDVVVVGAGPVGLALAIELGRRGVRCLVVEQNERVGNNPRAKTTNVRTMEHLRRWGIADKLREASRLPPDYPSDIIFATRLNGPQLAKISNANNCALEHNDLYSEPGQWIPQYVLEEVLRTHAVTLPGVEIRFQTMFADAVQDAEGVTTTLKDVHGGEERVVRSRYLIGADGSRSAVREKIGATMDGNRGFAANYNVLFRSPELVRLNPQGRAIMYWMINEEMPSVVGPMEGLDVWFFIATRIAGNAAEIDPKDVIQKATGFEFEMEILGTSPWVAHSLIANKYSDGRIFLAGDACHLHPPFGGFGMNMGVADGVDLGWKIAAVLQGWGGPELLGSYETERRPVHVRVMDEAAANYNALGNHLTLPGLEAPGPVGDATRREAGDVIFAAKLREFKTLGVVLGYRYSDSSTIIPDGTAAPEPHSMIYRPSAYPGCLAPHLWLGDGGSLYDQFGDGFTLLATGMDATAELSEAEAIAQRLGIPLKTLEPRDYRLPRRYMARFALIRPDQHVAWRGDTLREFDGILQQVSGGKLSGGSSN